MVAWHASWAPNAVHKPGGTRNTPVKRAARRQGIAKWALHWRSRCIAERGPHFHPFIMMLMRSARRFAKAVVMIVVAIGDLAPPARLRLLRGAAAEDISCEDDYACRNTERTCADDGHDCTLTCSGYYACRGMTIHGPPDPHKLHVICTGGGDWTCAFISRMPTAKKAGSTPPCTKRLSPTTITVLWDARRRAYGPPGRNAATRPRCSGT